MFVYSNVLYIPYTLHRILVVSYRKKYCISFIIRFLSVPIAEWLKCHAGQWGVAGSNPGGEIHHFEFFLYFPLITTRLIPYKWNQAWYSGVASQQGTLTLPDTWFRPPFWDLLMLQLLRPNSSNLPCLYSTFHLEYPLVLSRFCIHPE